jgi:hypothetical protein
MFDCQICGKIFKHPGGHIKTHKYTLKQYYDEFIKVESEEECKCCKKLTRFTGILSKGYSDYCGNRCSALGEGKGKWMKGNIHQKRRE